MTKEDIQKRATNSAARVWIYISKPFQITKVLELLYMFDWTWYAFVSFLPTQYITGSLFEVLRSVTTTLIIRLVLCSVALIHIYALITNYVVLRRINLVWNIAVLLYVTSVSFLKQPLSAGIGYLIILIGITVFAFWRMDETH